MEHYDGQVERPVPGPHQIVVQLLDPRLVRDRGEGERARARRLGTSGSTSTNQTPKRGAASAATASTASPA
jgi:hypothetical protein